MCIGTCILKLLDNIAGLCHQYYYRNPFLMPPQMPPVVVEIVEGSIEENSAIHAANE